MKRILLIAAILVGTLFYITATDYTESGYFTTDGYALSSKELQENLYSDSNGATIEAVKIHAFDTIFIRGTTKYVGEETKTKINTVFPMYLNEGTAVQFMENGVSLFNESFEKSTAFKGMILNNGTAFSEEYERADWETYYFAKLTNSLYVNSFAMTVKTYFNKYSIPSNALIYLTPNFIRYYYFENGSFKSGSVEDVDMDTTIIMNGNSISYKNLLLGLGEMTEVIEYEIPDQPEPVVWVPEEPEQKKTSAKPAKENPFADPEDPVADPTQIVQEEQEAEIDPNWVMPEVIPSNEYKIGVYTLTTEVKIKDVASAIVGGLTYEIIINEGDDAGKIYKRTAVNSSEGNVAVVISGLRSNYKYTVRAYYKYKDKYGKVNNAVVEFIKNYSFKTKELSELGEIELQNFMLSMASIFPDKIEIPNLCVSYQKSDMDAVSALSRILIRVESTDGKIGKGYIIDSVNFEKIKNFEAFNFISDSNLQADTQYKVEVRLYDRYGNELETKNNSFVTRTCKTLPTGKLTIKYPELKKVNFLATVSNPTKLNYTNLTLNITNLDGKIVQSFKNISTDKVITYETDGSGEKYIAILTVDADVNDNRGLIAHEIYRTEFSTNSLEQLGGLYLKTSNVTKIEAPNETDSCCVFTIALNMRFTDLELPKYVDYFGISLRAENGDTIEYALNAEELQSLKDYNTLTLSTKNFPVTLKSNETYSVYFTSFSIVGEKSVNIPVVSSFGSFKTTKAKVRVEMTNVKAFTGFITADIKISDLDNVIVGDTALLKVYRFEDNQPKELVGSFRLTKNLTDAYQLKMFNDATYSSDGVAYNIEGDTDYLFRFIAEEAVTDDASYVNYQLRDDENCIVSTAPGVTGKIYVQSVDKINNDTAHYTANISTKVNNPNSIMDITKVYVDITRCTVFGNSFVVKKELDIDLNAVTEQTFSITVDYDKSINNYYLCEMYLMIDSIRVPLNSVQFSTESPIKAIHNYKELIGVGSSRDKYVVVADISATKASTSSSYWETSTQLNAKIDFQGFTLSYNSPWCFWYSVGAKGEIKNLVYERYHVTARRTSQWGYYDAACGLIYFLYGRLENVSEKYYEEERPCEYQTYWTDIEDWEGEDHPPRYVYSRSNATLVNVNYGVIRNFVVEVQNQFTTYYNGGVVCRVNYGSISNGYVFGSDPEQDYKATFKIQYNAGSGSCYAGFVVSENTGGGSLENVYALANCDTANSSSHRGLLCSYNNSIVRNCYVSGHMLYNGTAYKRTHGPAIGSTSDSYITQNVYYISDYTYTIDKYNQLASVVALRNTTWQNSILNAGEGSFNVEEMMNVGCYPQINFTSKCMPIQKFFELPDIASEDTVDLIYSYAYELTGDEELDAICSPYMTGDEVWDKPDEAGNISDTQVVVMLIADKSSMIIDSIKMKNNCIQVEIIKQIMDGTGVTQLYLAVKNPTTASSQYQVDSIIFEDAYGDIGDIYQLNRAARYLNVDFYKSVYGITGDNSWQNLIKHPAENFRLKNDLDFSGYAFATQGYVASTYTGKLDGNNHAICNVEYTPAIFYQTGFLNQNINLYTGLFSTIRGTIKNLTLRNINIEGGTLSGALAGNATAATVENCFVVDSYITGLRDVGGLIGCNSLTTITNCGVSNCKIMSTGAAMNGDYVMSCVGGLLGRASSNSTITRCFAQDIYMESWIELTLSSMGGLVGVISGNQTSIRGCYATGTIEGNTDAIGGLVGRLYATAKIEDNYTNVNIIGYKSNINGLVGNNRKFYVSDDAGIVFGNVTLGTTYATGSDELNYATMVGDTTGNVNGYYYEGAALYINGVNITSTSDARRGKNVVSYSDMAEALLFNYISSDYFEVSGADIQAGLLPRVVDKNGVVLANQKKNYLVTSYSDSKISGYDNAITCKVESTAGGMTVIINHPSNIRIESIYTDYTYVDEKIGLYDAQTNTFNGVDSLTQHKVLSFGTTSYRRGQTETTASFSDLTYKAYYDYYKLTAIKYTNTDTNTVGYMSVSCQLSLPSQAKDICSVSEWYQIVGSSLNENFRITGDIDFNGIALSYDDEGAANKVIHRLIGTKNDFAASSDTGYLDYANGKEDTYYKICNATLAGNINYANDFGRCYAAYSGFIRTITAEIRNITFENITINSNRLGTCIIPSLTGIADNIVFAKCSITNTSGNKHTAPIGYSTGKLSHALTYKTYISGKGHITAGVIGEFDHYKYADLDYVDVIQSTITSTNSYTAGVVSVIQYQPYFYGALTAKVGNSNVVIDHFNIDSCKITGSSYLGGFASVMQGVCLRYVNTQNTYLRSSGHYVGAINGSYGDWLGSDCWYCTSYNNTVAGNEYVGGLHGFGHASSSSIIKDCLVVGNNQVGGVCGRAFAANSAKHISRSATVDPNIVVSNCKIVGNLYVGGYMGYTFYGLTYYSTVIDNCDIYGNSYVGGMSGYSNGSGGYASSVVKDCNIRVLTQSIADAYSSLYKLTVSATHNYFGGAFGSGGAWLYDTLVDNCWIGDSNCDYVGALMGACWINRSEWVDQAQSKDCIVVGRDKVGGIYGKVCTDAFNSNLTKSAYISSNAHVYGRSDVAGIAGLVYDVYDKKNDIYTNAPRNMYMIFTGTLNSQTNAALFYGQMKVRTMSFEALASMPAYVKCQTFDLLISNYSSDPRHYNFSKLLTETAVREFNVWDQTTVVEGTNSRLVSFYLQNAYSGFVKDDNNSAGFISRFTNHDDIDSRFYTVALKKWGRFNDVTTDDLLPLHHGYSTTYKSPIYNGFTYTKDLTVVKAGRIITTDVIAQGLAIPSTDYYSNYRVNMRAREEWYAAGYKEGVGVSGIIGAVEGTYGWDPATGAPATKANAQSADETICGYAIAADRINIDLGTKLAALCGDEGTIEISEGNAVVLASTNVDRRTYTLVYDFMDDLKVTVNYKVNGDIKSETFTIKKADLCRSIMVCGNAGYYLDENSLLHITTQSDPISNKPLVHIYEGQAMDAQGNLYNVSQSGIAAVETVLTEVMPYSEELYKFTYNDRTIYTFANYSYIYCNSTATTADQYRLFVKNGKLLVVNNNNSPIYDGVFQYYDEDDSYIAVLSTNGKILTLGNVDLTQRLSGFTNEGIVAMSNNMNSSTSIIMFTYSNGQNVGYDVLTGKQLFKTVATEKVDVLQYLTTSLNGIFNVTSSPLTTMAKQCDGLTELMNESDLTLNQIMELAAMNNNDIEQTVALIESGNVDAEALSGGITESSGSIADAGVIVPDIEELEDKIGKENKLPEGYTSSMKDEYISVYNAESGEFDIFNAKDLMEQSDKAVSQTSRIVDKATLKALYVSFATEDKTASTGAKLYVAVAATIVVLVFAVLSFRKKQQKIN